MSKKLVIYRETAIKEIVNKEVLDVYLNKGVRTDVYDEVLSRIRSLEKASTLTLLIRYEQSCLPNLKDNGLFNLTIEIKEDVKSV